MLRMGYIRNNKASQITLKGFLLCDLGEDRTLDPLIKRCRQNLSLEHLRAYFKCYIKGLNQTCTNR